MGTQFYFYPTPFLLCYKSRREPREKVRLLSVSYRLCLQTNGRKLKHNKKYAAVKLRKYWLCNKENTFLPDSQLKKHFHFNVCNWQVYNCLQSILEPEIKIDSDGVFHFYPKRQCPCADNNHQNSETALNEMDLVLYKAALV